MVTYRGNFGKNTAFFYNNYTTKHTALQELNFALCERILSLQNLFWEGMLMIFYHGSIKGGLTELRPATSWYSNLKEPTVYLTTSKQLATHYIWDMDRIGVKCPMLNIREDGVLVFQEMFSGALEYFYKGVSGYIYQCEGEYPLNTATGVHTCATSPEIVPVTGCEYVEDVYERILRYAEQGKFTYELFEDLHLWRRDVIRGHVMRFIKRNELCTTPDHPGRPFVEEKFPQYWAEAVVLQKHGLL